MINLEFEILPKTKSTNLKVEVFDLGVSARFIKKITVRIPPGHKGLAFLQITSPGLVLVPATGSNAQYIRGENETKDFDINKRLEGPPYQIICRGYNDDDFLPHSFIIELEI